MLNSILKKMIIDYMNEYAPFECIYSNVEKETAEALKHPESLKPFFLEALEEAEQEEAEQIEAILKLLEEA